MINVINILNIADLEKGFGTTAAANNLNKYFTQVNLLKTFTIKPLYGKEPELLKAEYLNCNFTRSKNSFKQIFNQLRPDVVHFHGIWHLGMRLVNILSEINIPVVVSPHGMLQTFTLNHKYFRKYLFSLIIQREAMRKSSVIHVLNKEEEKFVEEYVGMNSSIRSKCVVISNGVDSIPPLPTNFNSRPIKFLFCGQIIQRKRLEFLIDAWKIADIHINAKLVIAGTGEDKYVQKLMKKIKNTLGVEYIGFVSGHERLKVIAESHFGVLSSAGEGQPLALLESLSCGRPCIATPECCLKSLQSENIGWVAESIDQFADAFKNAAKLSMEEYSIKSQLSVKYIQKNHSWINASTTLQNIYFSLAHKREQS
jgi:glycosyltransferase involved in cell wall biosynthesis